MFTHKKSYQELHGVPGPTSQATFEEAYKAAVKGELSTVKNWVEKNKQDINRADKKSDYSLLHIAAGSGKTNVVEYLISQGANLDCYSHTNKDSDATKNITPLHLAARNGHLDVVRLLVEAGARVNAIDWLWRSAIHHVILSALKEEQALKIAEYLLNHGVDLTQVALFESGCSLKYNLTYFANKVDKWALKRLIQTKIEDFARLPQKVSQLEATVAQLQTTVQALIAENKALKAAQAQAAQLSADDNFNPRVKP